MRFPIRIRDALFRNKQLMIKMLINTKTEHDPMDGCAP